MARCHDAVEYRARESEQEDPAGEQVAILKKASKLLGEDRPATLHCTCQRLTLRRSSVLGRDRAGFGASPPDRQAGSAALLWPRSRPSRRVQASPRQAERFARPAGIAGHRRPLRGLRLAAGRRATSASLYGGGRSTSPGTSRQLCRGGTGQWRSALRGSR